MGVGSLLPPGGALRLRHLLFSQPVVLNAAPEASRLLLSRLLLRRSTDMDFLPWLGAAGMVFCLGYLLGWLLNA